MLHLNESSTKLCSLKDPLKLFGISSQGDLHIPKKLVIQFHAISSKKRCLALFVDPEILL